MKFLLVLLLALSSCAQAQTLVGTRNGGTGQNWASSSGIPLLTSGTSSLLSSSGTSDVVRRTSPTMDGTVIIGLGGSGSTNGDLRLDGSSADNFGPILYFRRGGVAKGYCGTGSVVNGGSGDEIVCNSGSSFSWTISGTGRGAIDSTGIKAPGATSVMGAPRFIATGGTAPTCTTNCGTSPSVTGNDSGFTVTMGASGAPASGWVITFNNTWGAAPACHVQMALAGMVVGKMALTAVTSTGTLTVVTNGTAPATSDKYHVVCIGTG